MSKYLVGKVVSNQMEKTITVEVSRLTRHPLYGKRLRRHKKFLVHDPQQGAQVGQKVVIQETRPVSKRKRWVLVKILDES